MELKSTDESGGTLNIRRGEIINVIYMNSVTEVTVFELNVI